MNASLNYGLLVGMFHYSSYWGTWSRVLSTSDPNGPFVEVNLTPTNGWNRGYSFEDDVSRIRIRFHGTVRDRNDKVVPVLPDYVKEGMIKHLGAELTERLLTEDFYSQIDYVLYRKHCNGGALFDQIKKR